MAGENDEPMPLSWLISNPPDPHDPEMYNRLCAIVGKQAESGFRPVVRAFVRLESEGVEPDDALRIIVFLLAAEIAKEVERDDHAQFGQRYAEALDQVTAPTSFGGQSFS
jgi:hypothetical protein